MDDLQNKIKCWPFSVFWNHGVTEPLEKPNVVREYLFSIKRSLFISPRLKIFANRSRLLPVKCITHVIHFKQWTTRHSPIGTKADEIGLSSDQFSSHFSWLAGFNRTNHRLSISQVTPRTWARGRKDNHKRMTYFSSFCEDIENFTRKRFLHIRLKRIQMK